MVDSKENGVHLDEILSPFGLHKPYQIQAISLLGILFLVNGMHCINFIFVAEESPYRCKIDKCESEDASFSSLWYNYTAPSEYRNCRKYGLISNSAACSPEGFNRSIMEPCTDWVYGAGNNFVSEFQLACEDWKVTFVGTIHGLGLMVGLLIQGQFSDKLGRKAAIIIAGVAAASFGLAKSFATTYSVFILFELLESIFGDNCSPGYIMSVELLDHEHRLNQQIIISILYSFGGVMLAIAGAYIKYWRTFVQVIYAPSFLFLLYIFFMDESVRWLLSKGKKEEATTILRKMARKNKMKIDDRTLLNLKYEEEAAGGTKSPLLQTFRSKVVVKRFCICLIWWISCTFIYFGLIVNSVSLAGNKYVNLAILSVADMPVCLVMVVVLKRFKRKKPLILSFIAAGTLCIVQTFVPKVYPVLSIGLYLFGKFLSTFTYEIVYLYTSELFPTYTRNSMHALCSSIGRIGSVLAPLTPLLMEYGENLPTLLIGGISILAGIATFLVPDIANEALPDNVEQAEQIGKVEVDLTNSEQWKRKSSD